MRHKKLFILVISLFLLLAPPAFGLECTTDNHCPADQFCYNYECHLPTCQTDSDCQPGYFCYLKMCYLEDTCFGAECRPDCSNQPAVCSQTAPDESCECRSAPFCQCQDYCTRLYCGNEVCTQWQASCRSEWFCQSQTPSVSCDCWNLNSDHPDPLRVQRGEALNFTAEVATPNSGPANPNLNFTLKHKDQIVARSGNLLAGLVRRETQKNIYQASWSWTVPNNPQAKGDYHLHLDFNCNQAGPQNFTSSAKPTLPAPLWERILVFLGLTSPQEATTQVGPTLPPTFPPDEPTIIRPESGLTLQLGTFLLPLPENTCYDFYFRVID